MCSLYRNFGLLLDEIGLNFLEHSIPSVASDLYVKNGTRYQVYMINLETSYEICIKECKFHRTAMEIKSTDACILAKFMTDKIGRAVYISNMFMYNIGDVGPPAEIDETIVNIRNIENIPPPGSTADVTFDWRSYTIEATEATEASRITIHLDITDIVQDLIEQHLPKIISAEQVPELYTKDNDILNITWCCKLIEETI
jgi:hypothetical protein